jgi:hypothetical protein
MARQRERAGALVAGAAVLLLLTGLARQAEAQVRQAAPAGATATGLRGSVSQQVPAAVPAVAAAPAAHSGNAPGRAPSAAAAGPQPLAFGVRGPAPDAATRTFLERGVWRAGACGSARNFQTFRFAPALQVEVGSGAPGSGEVLEMIAAGRHRIAGADLVEVQTRVCAPVGCNQTFELYRVLDADRIQEWRFEGRLPDLPPNVVVVDGRASDGTAGRVFTRCTQ